MGRGRETETNHKRLSTTENKRRVDGRRWVGEGLVGGGALRRHLV